MRIVICIAYYMSYSTLPEVTLHNGHSDSCHLQHFLVIQKVIFPSMFLVECQQATGTQNLPNMTIHEQILH
jgi:hypothetical protein